jgi:glycerol uptake facilitator protein
MHAYMAEFVGTGMLLLLGNGVVCNVVLRDTKGSSSGWMVITAGWGFAVFVAVAMTARYSGAHINPAVTLGLAVAGKFAWADVLPYIGAQMAGAMAGTSLAFLAYLPHYRATEDAGLKLATFCTAPAIRMPRWNFFTEVIGTFALVFGVLLFAQPGVTIGGEAGEIGLGSIGAIPAGLLVFGIGLSLGGPTGYAINPARDLGPRIMHALLPVPRKGGGDWGYAPIPVVGPLVGAVIAAGVALGLGVVTV